EVDEAIESLPEDERIPIILYFLRGLDENEVAHELGISRARVNRRLHLGIRRLRASLSTSAAIVPVGVLAAGLKAGNAIAAPASLTAGTGKMALAAVLRKAPGHPWRVRVGDWIGTITSLLSHSGPPVWTAILLLAATITAAAIFVRRETRAP